MLTTVLFAAGWSAGWLLPAAGQAAATGSAGVPVPLSVNGVRDLTFGTVFAGTPATISRRDPTRAGRFEIRGFSTEIRLDFLLPEALRSPGGHLLPLVFGPGDADAIPGWSREDTFVFDPRTPLVAVIGRDGLLVVRLGGTVDPAPRQASDSYSATVILTVFYLGT